ncbi:MAG: Hpt domain-containing protein, partial [Holophaga sp.]|nr:Hpt domain-containing protein [Holophaga sp.]
MGSLADDNLILEFVAESREHLSTIEPDLLAMEQEGAHTSQEVINRVFRAIHSIKGGAGFFAFEAIKSLSHIMESVLMQVRDRAMAVT